MARETIEDKAEEAERVWEVLLAWAGNPHVSENFQIEKPPIARALKFVESFHNWRNEFIGGENDR